jgi:hypothetical protein
MALKHSILSFCAKSIQEIYDDVELFMNMSRCDKNSGKSHTDNIILYYNEEMFVLYCQISFKVVKVKERTGHL